MSVDLGDRLEDSIIYFMWSTNAADGSSITRTIDGTISIYKNDDLSQSVAGITDTEDFDSLTGIHMCKIDTSADAFYAVAEDYTVVLSGATIDGKSVNAVLAVFSIENRFMRGTDSAALAATALTDVMWTDAKAGALTDWIDGGRLDLIIDAIVADTLEIGTAGAGLTDLGGMSTNMKSEVNAEASDVMVTDTIDEPPQGPPPATPTPEQVLAYMYFRMMNKNEETTGEHSVYDVAGTTKVIKADMSDVAGVLTKGKFESGA